MEVVSKEVKLQESKDHFDINFVSKTMISDACLNQFYLKKF